MPRRGGGGGGGGGQQMLMHRKTCLIPIVKFREARLAFRFS